MIMRGVFNVKKSAIWHTIAPIYGATTVITTDMLPWTAQIRYHHLAHQHAAGLTPMTGMIDPPLDIIATPDIHTMITRIDPGSVVPGPVPITIDIGVAAIRTPIEAAPGHSTDLPNTVSHATEAQVPTATAATHCTTDLHLIGILPMMTADLDTNPKNKHHRLAQGSLSTLQATPWKHKEKRHKQVTIDDPPSEYYSSDDHDSDSEDDLN